MVPTHKTVFKRSWVRTGEPGTHMQRGVPCTTGALRAFGIKQLCSLLPFLAEVLPPPPTPLLRKTK